jgi:hypothetical protein
VVKLENTMITIIKDMSINLTLYLTTCKYCGSVFKHDETDLVKDLPKNSTIEIIDCPICKKRVDAQRIVSLENMPKPPPPRSPFPPSCVYKLNSGYMSSLKKIFKLKHKE